MRGGLRFHPQHERPRTAGWDAEPAGLETPSGEGADLCHAGTATSGDRQPATRRRTHTNVLAAGSGAARRSSAPVHESSRCRPGHRHRQGNRRPHPRDVSVGKSNQVAVENLLSPEKVDWGTAAVPVHVFMMSGTFLPPSHPRRHSDPREMAYGDRQQQDRRGPGIGDHPDGVANCSTRHRDKARVAAAQVHDEP
jgi:hypothetical protein